MDGKATFETDGASIFDAMPPVGQGPSYFASRYANIRDRLIGPWKYALPLSAVALGLTLRAQQPQYAQGTAETFGWREVAQSCLNEHGPQGLRAQRAYVAWAGSAAQFAPQTNIGTVAQLADPTDCILVSQQPLEHALFDALFDSSLPSQVVTFASAARSLHEHTAQAHRYYDARAYEQDNFAQASALHAPLLAAFDAFANAERDLRNTLTQRMHADASAFAKQIHTAGDACSVALMAAGSASLGLAAIVNPPNDNALSVDKTAFAGAVETFANSNRAFTHACDGVQATEAMRRQGERVLESAQKSLSRVAVQPGFSVEERYNAELEGSPAALVQQVQAFVVELDATDTYSRARFAELAPALLR